MVKHEGNTFDALMDAAVDAIILIDQEGRIERFNRAAVEMFGYEESEIFGQNVSILMPEPHSGQHDGYLVRYRENGDAAIIGRGREETACRKNGEEFPILLTVGEFRQQGGRKFVGFVRDMSESRAAEEQVRKLEAQLVHADRLVALGELTAGIAHEINQPLTAIAAYADAGRAMIDREGNTLRSDMHSICERIGAQSRRAAEVVQRLRRLVRSGTVVKARHEINNIIKNVLLLFEYEINKTGIHIEYIPAQHAPEIYVDDVQIQQVLVNLVKNSMDALVQAGIKNGLITISVTQRDAELDVSVTDNGPGVPEKNRERLFEAFFTTRDQGVGLGLSICKSISAAHGGKLKHSSPKDGGSRFTLSLPLESIG
jgi:two-component system sensor kinase FixL